MERFYFCFLTFPSFRSTASDFAALPDRLFRPLGSNGSRPT
jgi:hypothetical protein